MLGPRPRTGPRIGEKTVEVKSLEGPGSWGDKLVKCELKKIEQHDQLGKMKCERNFVRKLNKMSGEVASNFFLLVIFV